MPTLLNKWTAGHVSTSANINLYRDAVRHYQIDIVTDLLKALLGNRPENTYHSNVCLTIGRPLLVNAWVDTPYNNTWYPLLSSWCVFCGWSVPSLYRKQWNCSTGVLIRVEAGSSTSTVAQRVVGGDEKGSLKSETVKYGRESQGTPTRKGLRWQGPASYTKDRPVLSSERAPQKTRPYYLFLLVVWD
jgi:hypothetical protein